MSIDRNVLKRLDAIEKTLDEVQTILRHNKLKGPPAGEPKIYDMPDEETMTKWLEEDDD